MHSWISLSKHEYSTRWLNNCTTIRLNTKSTKRLMKKSQMQLWYTCKSVFQIFIRNFFCLFLILENYLIQYSFNIVFHKLKIKSNKLCFFLSFHFTQIQIKKQIRLKLCGCVVSCEWLLIVGAVFADYLTHPNGQNCRTYAFKKGSKL